MKIDNLDRSQFQIQPAHQTSHSQGLLSTRYYVYSSDLGACFFFVAVNLNADLEP